MKILKVLMLLFAFGTKAWAAEVVVANAAELKSAVAKANPGDVVLLKNQVWKDVQLVLKGKGTKQRPIVIKPQSGDEIKITGKSNLKIAGEYLVIKGFHFTNGYSPKDHLITFRIDDDNLANNCRITQFAIEDFSQPERFSGDSWVVFWGKNNRVDHCTFSNKLNAGPVIIAELNDERSQKNFHSIDSNYFNGRERFGSNGGETIRIGVSRYSLTASNTQIVHNYFERCSGEVEIVSIKSGENNVSFNTFFECEGSLVLRHGSSNVVEGNLFLGNNKPFTGGVRIINPGHIVKNNVFKDLKGTAFRSPLAIMNGVPNSLINRYYQVKDVKVENNTFINCKPLLFGAGKDAERTLSPQNVLFTNNLVSGVASQVYNDDNNDGGIIVQSNASDKKTSDKGFAIQRLSTIAVSGFSLPYANNVGAPLKRLEFVAVKDVGAKWFKKENPVSAEKPSVFTVNAAQANEINSLVNKMKDGDVLELTEAAIYKISNELNVSKSITIKAANNLVNKPILINATQKSLASFITISNGATLKVSGLVFKGAEEGYADVKCGIRSTELPMNKHYKLFVDRCEFYNYNESSFSAFKASKSTLADSLVFTNSLFRNISGTAINLGEEREDKGIYGAEYTIVKNCIFTNILGSALNVYRGGNDESTLGPFVEMENCTINEVDNREQGAAVRLVGVQNAKLLNNNFVNSGQGGRAIEFREFRWDNVLVDYSNFYQSGKIESFYGKLIGKNNTEVDPKFNNVMAFDFGVKENNPLTTKGADGKNIGAKL